MMFVFFNTNANAQTAGTLTFSFTPTSHTGYSGTRNALAVWIEKVTTGTPTAPVAGTFVKTKLRYAGAGHGTSDHIPTWTCQSGGSCTIPDALAAACNIVGATTGATLTTFSTKTISWDGTNAAGTVVVDGNYQVVIQETWNHGTTGTAIRYFPFVKGPSLDSQTPANDTNFTNISLNSSFLGVNDFSSKPEVAIYPNPTNGIFNMDLKNDINNIKVINILGKVVYNEKVTQDSAGTTKKVDLSNLVNGLYIVSITNENGTSNYKVVLNK